MNFFSRLSRFFKGVTVFALVGESGTGKSYHAKILSEQLGIDLIIDDGLLIRGDKIVGGHSAKKEKNYMGAIRCALFDEKSHRDEIARCLYTQKFKKILILGTSEKMVNKIAVRLQLPPPQKIIRIEEIASREEIEKALRSRRVEGKHVIPVPSMEIQRNYSQIFYDRVKVFFSRKQNILGGRSERVFEKSVVRPEFSQKSGKVTISEAALSQIAIQCIEEYDKDVRVKKLSIKNDPRGYRLVILMDVPFGTQLIGKIHQMQEYIVDNVERYTGILIEDAHIIIDKITRADTAGQKPKSNNKTHSH